VKLVPKSEPIPLPRPATDARGVESPTFDAKGAAAYLGMSVSWLWQSDVPRVRLGTRTKWLRDDLDAYLKAHRSHGSAA
jgi:predicted DNA-binding transcriptional regulator AlpA